MTEDCKHIHGRNLYMCRWDWIEQKARRKQRKEPRITRINYMTSISPPKFPKILFVLFVPALRDSWFFEIGHPCPWLLRPLRRFEMFVTQRSSCSVVSVPSCSNPRAPGPRLETSKLFLSRALTEEVSACGAALAPANLNSTEFHLPQIVD